MQLEKEVQGLPGWLMVVVLLAVALGSAWFFVQGVQQEAGLSIVLAILVLLADLALLVRAHRGQSQHGQGRHAVRRLQGLDQEAGLLVGESALDSPRNLAARPQFRKRQAEGQRSRRQPDRNRGRHRVAGGGDLRSCLQRGRLRELRARPDRVGAARHGHELPVRRARGRQDVAAAVRPPRSPTACAARSRNAWRRPG